MHNAKKMKQKEEFDQRHKVSKKSVKNGDIVLIKQRETTVRPPFDPFHFEVSEC